MKVVLDSNVFLSALLLGRNCEEILELSRARVIEVLVSEEILSELERVLRKRFRWTESDIREFSDELREIGTLVDCGAGNIEFSPDPGDAKILACAVAGKADVIVTGDKKHLLPKKKFRGIPILSPADFLDRMG
ncbi:MAG: putative toxin-antitoxin system toxin component, PIN family [Deltaproteobacteria bacterium]|nr:putative toxin-antitoxin system toxin component, PIN family [Deltaproteobacteria bacterium]